MKGIVSGKPREIVYPPQKNAGGKIGLVIYETGFTSYCIILF